MESSARNVEESIKIADDVAQMAKNVVEREENAMNRLEVTGEKLEQAVEASKSFVTAVAGEDSISDAMDASASEVFQELQAVQNIADVVSRKVEMEADAILAMGESKL